MHESQSIESSYIVNEDEFLRISSDPTEMSLYMLLKVLL